MTLLDQDKEVVLPEQITEPVRRVAERSWALRVSLGLLQGATLGMAVTLGGILALGMLPALPIWLRIPLAIGSWGIGLWGVVHWALPAFKRLPFFAAARAIDEAHPELHERITSAIELAAEEDKRFAGSPELLDKLMQQAEADAAVVDPSQVVSGKQVLRWSLLAGAVGIMYMVALLSAPQTFHEGLRGMAMPWVPGRTHPPLVLKMDPGENITVAQGESLDITVTVTDPASSNLLVDRAIITLRYTNGPAQAVEMERADANMFRTRLGSIQQNLSYSVAAAGEETPMYKINVVPRPGVSSMNVIYNYPAYTKLSPKTEKDPANGTLDAIAGTHAQVTIHTTQPVDPERCTVVVGQGQSVVTLKPIDATTLTGEVIMTASAPYTVNLVSMIDGREMRSDTSRPRQIVVRPDNAPTINIASPSASAKIRPDDTAPIKFAIDDDFGVVSAELVYQVDNRSPMTMPIDLAKIGGTRIEQSADLSVRDAIQKSAVRDPKRITYFLRATDNAQPKANIGTSQKQVLLIDRNAERMALSQQMAGPQGMSEALRTAEQKLISASKKLAELDKVSADRQLTGGERQRLVEARQEMTDAAEAIDKAVDQAPAAYQNQKDQLRKINDDMVRPGTEATARAELADNGKRRQDNVHDAADEAIKARDQIAALRQNVDKNVEAERLQKSLEDAAKRQEQIARDLENGNKSADAQRRQEALKKDVEQMIRENQNLRDAEKQKAQPKVDELTKKIDDIAQRQQKTNEQIAKAAESAQINETLKKIIAEQQKLNGDIGKYDKRFGKIAQNASVPVPDETKMDGIVKNLQDNKLNPALVQQRSAAGELDKISNRATGTDEQQAGEDPDALKDEVDTLINDVRVAKSNGQEPTRPSDPANQKAVDLATRIQKAVSQPAITQEQRKAQDEARKLAQEATLAARTGKAEQAVQKLRQAIGAAMRMQRSTPKISPQAGQQAKTLADRQREIADELAKLLQAQAETDKRNEDLKNTQAEQQQIARDLEQAAQQARQLAQDTQATTPETAQQANQAADQLKKAADDQKKAADASQDAQKTPQAAQASQRSASEIQQAKDTLQQTSANNDQQQNQNAQQNQSQQAQQNGQQQDQQAGQQQTQNQQGQQQAQQAGQQSTQQQSGSQQQQQNGGQNSQQQQLTQAVQAAHEAQQQAMQGNSQAAQQAAQQLAKAQQIAQQMSSQSGQQQPGQQGQQSAQGQSGQQQSQNGKSTQAQANSQNKGQPNTDGSDGTGPEAGKFEGDAPTAVTAIGIAPSDWAKLPPLMQKDLLNAAQQKGPPEYQQMIKNYYTQIARMQAQGGEAK